MPSHKKRVEFNGRVRMRAVKDVRSFTGQRRQRAIFRGSNSNFRFQSNFIVSYAKPNVKVILTGSSTKYSLVQMGMLKRLEPNIKSTSLTAVTLLDEA